MSATGPGPQERVRAFVDAMHDDFPDRDTIGLGYYSSGKQELTATDLRDVLNELDEHQRLLEQIDEVLDRHSEFSNEDADTLYDIRALLGNHTEDKL